jgi:hypothetical protein
MCRETKPIVFRILYESTLRTVRITLCLLMSHFDVVLQIAQNRLCGWVRKYSIKFCETTPSSFQIMTQQPPPPPPLFHHLENGENIPLTQCIFLPSVLLNSFCSKKVANYFRDSRRNACHTNSCWRVTAESIGRSDHLWFRMLSDAINDYRVLETTKRAVIHYTNRRT